MPILTQEQQEYNTLIKRLNKACLLIDDEKIPISQREKWIPEFKRILKSIHELAEKIKKSGYEMTDSEILDGFEEV